MTPGLKLSEKSHLLSIKHICLLKLHVINSRGGFRRLSGMTGPMSDLPLSELWTCSSSYAALSPQAKALFCSFTPKSVKKKTWTVSVLKRPREGRLFYAAHSVSKHNIVLPTASLGVSCTVRNEAALDPRRFHRSPLFNYPHPYQHLGFAVLFQEAGHS